MGFVSKHRKRDKELPKFRDILLKKALEDLTSDPDVLAIYLAGSLAKGKDDDYSDIDLHTIVSPDRKKEFIKDKRNRSGKWGEVLFYEDSNPSSPVVVTHYDCFVKVDSWYHTIEEIDPSIWLKGIKVVHDPHNLLSTIVEESSKIANTVAKEDVEFWRGKFLAYIHETYRAVMRKELYYALSNLDSVRWLLVSGWYMEMDEHIDASYGVWSKLEGKRSKLSNPQLDFLASLEASRDAEAIMEMIAKLIPEFIRLNEVLSKCVGIRENKEIIIKALGLVI